MPVSDALSKCAGSLYQTWATAVDDWITFRNKSRAVGLGGPTGTVMAIAASCKQESLAAANSARRCDYIRVCLAVSRVGVLMEPHPRLNISYARLMSTSAGEVNE